MRYLDFRAIDFGALLIKNYYEYISSVAKPIHLMYQPIITYNYTCPLNMTMLFHSDSEERYGLQNFLKHWESS